MKFSRIAALLLCLTVMCSVPVTVYGAGGGTVTMSYDDCYTFEAEVDAIETLTVTSRQNGTETPDAAVLVVADESNPARCRAVGVGTARVTLKNGTIYQVAVRPAPISVALIIGQSNAEGSTTSTPTVYMRARNQSIVCEDGQAYSTYAWSSVFHADACGGRDTERYLTVEDAPYFVGTSLTGRESYGGEKLEYPLSAFTASGKGKTGIDSGLAFEWNAFTGEKIWVVNCAAGSSAIATWVPSGDNYKECVAVMKLVQKTMNAEVAAGHYVLKHFFYLWLQGESDKTMTADNYDACFRSMHTALTEDLRWAAQNKELEACGIIMVRAFTQTNDAADIFNNGPRTAQKNAVASDEGVYRNVCMACDKNDLWISDKNVEAYWNTRYPASQYPFTVHSQAYVNPTTVSRVHTGIHYLQPGYNEIGMVSAENMALALDPVMLGDLDGSRVVDTADLVMLAKHIAGINGARLSAQKMLAANVTKDENGTVDVSDLVIMAKKVAGMSVTF